jgi:HAD superfamily hydrolase (TIGR01549 family)
MDTWAGLEALIFDLDGTLHFSSELMAAYPRLAVQMAAERLGISLAEAQRRFEESRRSLHTGRNGAVTNTQALVDLAGVTLSEWASYVAAHVHPEAYLDPADYDWLRPLLTQLRRHYRLGIVSNNNRVLAGRILALLSIADCFDAILTISESGRTKPDPTLYRDIAALLGVPPAACLSIGDRQAVDIEPAEEAGMRGALVAGPASLRGLCAELLAAAEPSRESGV